LHTPADLSPALLDQLAAEYVLGTLRGSARHRFEALQRDWLPARDAVAAWEGRLHKLAVAVPPVAPPAALWQAIEARVQSAPPAPAAWRALLSWLRPALGFAFGAALALGVVQLAPDAVVSLDRVAQRAQALPQSYVGLLTDANNVPHLLVSSTRHGTRVSVKSLRPWQVPPGKVAQVWALPRDRTGAELPPTPLGIARPAVPPGSTSFELTATSEALLSNVPRLAVSLEDRPARAGDRPGGFVFSGFCVKLW
jgi:anti-sigma-K factor RskA